MTALLLVLVSLALAVAGALFFMHDPGYVLITLEPWSVEVSLALFVILLALAFLVLYFVIRTLVRIWKAPGDLRQARQRRRVRKAQALRATGMLALIEGDWSRAEKKLLSHLPYTDHEVLNYIGAAQAAHSQGQLEQRDRYLEKARQLDPKHALEVDLSQALLQYRGGEFSQAATTLVALRRDHPKNAKILGLVIKTCEELEDWAQVLELLPAARKLRALPDTELERLQKSAAARVLGHSDPQRLQQAWQALPRAEQADSELLAAYAERLIQLGRMDEAETVLRKALRRHWVSAWVRLYGRVVSSDLSAQLKHAEQWAQAHGEDPELLLALARICLNQELWGKARSYLEACIGAGGAAEAYEELGRLLEQLDDPEKALAYYRDGLRKATVPGGGERRQITHVKPYDELG